MFRQFLDNESKTYTYFLADKEGKAIVIDPVIENFERDCSFIDELNLDVGWVLETHVHADHVTSSGKLKERCSAQVGVSEMAGVSNADGLLKDKQEIQCGELNILCIATPGHTDGCMSFLIDNRLFTGDCLMIRGCGRTDFQQGSPEKLFYSVREKLFQLPDDYLVYPAHDYKGRSHSTIGEEKNFNPRLKLSNNLKTFIEIMNQLKLAPPQKIEVAVPKNLNLGL